MNTTSDSTESTFSFQQQASVAPEYDVVVVGGGPAGLGAAIAAARSGARTRLVESKGFLGGNLTAGLIGPCMTSYSLDGRTQLIRGIFDEFIRRMVATGDAIHPSDVSGDTAYSGFIAYGHERVTPFEPEAAKWTAQQMCEEAGVDLLFHSFVLDTVVEDGAVKGVVMASKSGLTFQPAKVVIDCSADADVAARAGVPFDQGRDEDGLTQPMSLFFRVSGVDDEVVERYIREHTEDRRPFASIVEKAKAEGRFTLPRRAIGLFRMVRPGMWRINTTRILEVDGTDVADLSRAEREGRRQVMELVDFFRSDLPGFENCELHDTAATVGVRETRRIRGEYTLELEDLQTGRRFDDVIAVAGYPVDIHSPTDGGGGVDEKYATANIYSIPYRSLVPQGVDDLLVAGRSISSSHEALGAVRVMPPSFAMGEAAGTAAAQALKDGTTVRDVDIAAVQDTLRSNGAYLGEEVAA